MPLLLVDCDRVVSNALLFGKVEGNEERNADAQGKR
jgi:hypothetical protein